MKRDEAVKRGYEHIRNGEQLNGHGQEDIETIMDSVFSNTGVDWRLAVGINRVCPECGGSRKSKEEVQLAGGMHFLKPCPTCHGTGSVKKEGQ